jgi:hypothetical protein
MPFFQSRSLKELTRPIIDAIPGARRVVQRLRHGKKPPPEFSGWGMSTNRVPPWKNGTALSKDFLKVNDELVKAVRDGRFHMTQYADFKDKEAILKDLLWRHYAIFWSARFAGSRGSSLVECGVSDGLTAFFAAKAVNNAKKIYLYDAWDKMHDEDLLETESLHSDYGYLTLERTQKNLEGLNAEYVKGYIPDVFKKSASPKEIMWLHIDLNNAKPTKESLEEMYKNVISGAVIIFDDYAGRAFGDTRRVVDEFFADKDGMLLPMPTGQAMFFKR